MYKNNQTYVFFTNAIFQYASLKRYIYIILKTITDE